jgi:hypothetical protein
LRRLPSRGHVALLSPEFLLRLGLSSGAKVLDLKERVRCRGCGARGLGVDQEAEGGRIEVVAADEDAR